MDQKLTTEESSKLHIDERDAELRMANFADRIVACVNACAGMDDPAEEIEALKQAVAWQEKI